LGSSGRLAVKIGLEIPLRILKVSRVFMILLPLYYLIVFPITVILNWIDSHAAHLNGSGILVLAWK
jgi:hypothetical protein